jgi:hypothetical protein
VIAEQETAVRNALLAARASIDAALALLSTRSVPADWVTAAAVTPNTAPVAASGGMGPKTVTVQAGPCAHPPQARQAAGGFGEKATGRFYCRACELMVEE